MEDVRFYNFECKLLHIEHRLSSCNWTFYENDIGTFEMHFSLDSALSSVLAENPYLVAVQGEKQAIVTGYQLLEEGVLYGRSCNWLLTKFLIAETFNTKSLFDNKVIADENAETVCKYLLSVGMGQIESVVFEENQSVKFGDVFLENAGISSVFDLVKTCMSKAGGGHTLRFDMANKRWIFSLTKGEKLAVSLSEDNQNAYDVEYLSDLLDFSSGGYYQQEIEDMGEWDIYKNSPSLSTKQTSNYAKGYRVRLSESETGYKEYTRFGITFENGDYIVCKNPEGVWEKAYRLESFTERISPTLSGIYAWETVLEGKSRSEAEKALAEHNISRKIVLKARNFIFGRDYQLGDIVLQKLVKGEFSSCVMRKITGVNLWYEADETGEQPIFTEGEENSWGI